MLINKLVSTCLIAAACAAAAPIGMITASGHFTVAGSVAWGNATLFDGARVETSDASSELRLTNGVRVQLGAASRAQIWADHLVLERGVGQVGAPAAFRVSADGFEIRPEGAGARVRIALGQDMEVTALAGGARVEDRRGVLMAAITQGQGAKIALQANQSVVTHTGCLLSKDGRYIQQDEETMQVFELNGPSLSANVGNRVQTTGRVSNARPAIQIATAVINVNTVSPRSQGGCLSVASSLDASANPVEVAPGAAPPAAPQQPTPASAPASAPAPASAGGLSKGAKIGIIAAVSGGGAGAAIALAGGKKSTSP